MKKKIVITANQAWYLANFQCNLIRALVERGYDVIAAAAPSLQHEAVLRAAGARFASIPIDSKGISPLRDLATWRAYRRLLERERPVAFLGSTIKANIWGGWAAAQVGIPYFATISGLGTAFIRRTWLTVLVEQLYRRSLRRAEVVFFQNTADCDLFVERGMVRREQAELVPGSGVDLNRFTPAPMLPVDGRPFTFLLVGRLLRDKGIVEYVEAARAIKRERPHLRFLLLGPSSVENRTAIAPETIAAWRAEGAVELLPEVEDVRPFVAASDCVVLPSYREGTSQALLEAAAMARPIVATDVPGCREVVIDGENGFLCEARNSASLAAAMRRMIDLVPAERARMGAAGRTRTEQNFSKQIVVQRYFDAMKRVIGD